MVKPKPRRCLSQHWEKVVRATISLAAGITSPRLIQYLTKTETIQRSNIQTEVREASYGTRDRVHRGEVGGREPVRHHPNDQKVWGGQGAWRVLAARQHAAKPKEKIASSRRMELKKPSQLSFKSQPISLPWRELEEGALYRHKKAL